MKLAFSTLGCPDWTFEQVLDNARAMGYQGIEVRGIGEELRAERLAPFLPANAERTKDALKARGLELCALGTSVSFDRDADKKAALDEGRAAIEVCARMDIPFLRVFGNRMDENEPAGAATDRVAEGLSLLLAELRGTPVRILLEVHGDFDRVERLRPVMEAVAHPQCGLLWDIQHSDKVYGADFEAFYRPLKPYIRHIHIKDLRRGPEGAELCAVGDGELPVASIVLMLERTGYDGFYSFEWEKRWHPSLPGAEAVFPAYVRWMRALGE